MNGFNKRWRQLVRAARTAPGSQPALPPAPVHRVRAWLKASPARASGTGGEAGVLDLWLRYGVRSLATASVVLAGMVGFAAAGAAREHNAGPLQPGLEQAVVEPFWLL